MSSSGLEMTGSWATDEKGDYSYLYNGKELHRDFGLGWYAYVNEAVRAIQMARGRRETALSPRNLQNEARVVKWFYDPEKGRFTGVDPISDKFAHVSTFNYAENNPVRFIDLWGLQAAEPWPNQEVQKGAQKIADGITAILNYAKRIFTEGNAPGGNGNGPAMETDQGVTILSNSDKKSVGSNPAVDGQGSTVIIETNELLIPNAAGLMGAEAQKAGGVVNVIDKGANALNNLDNAIERFENTKKNIFNDDRPAQAEGKVDTIVNNGEKFEITQVSNKGKSSSKLIRPIKE